MYRRFLRDEDYLSIISQDTLAQMTRGNADRFIQAEESAEMSIIEHLSENYEVEKELNKGKYIAVYDRRITFPVGVHLSLGEKVYKVTRSISGYKMPSENEYWEVCSDVVDPSETFENYSQFSTYYLNDRVYYNGTLYTCITENGFNFGEIRMPLVHGWIEVQATLWQPVHYNLWEVVEFQDEFYTLIQLENFDNNIDPKESDNWGAIADYDPDYNEYRISDNEYVVYKGRVYHPETDVNSDLPVPGINLVQADPRNYNLKKHMVRLAIYELTKLIAPNNVSVVRVKDYEESMKWLSDAARLKLNPQIPRKLAEDKKEVMDWQLATFQTSYDPYKNPWLT